ncbi:MAG: hypothetical protein CMM46_06080 [Rhodospirillaceae bacterium]|nr:hypothetical protein [Rhodospirillaceae bacterium]
MSYVEQGGFVQRHHDRFPLHEQTGQLDLRCNVMVEKGDPLGNPIVEHKSWPVSVRSLWAFLPSERLHWTLPHQSDEPRIVFQYGFTVPAGFDLVSVPGTAGAATTTDDRNS